MADETEALVPAPLDLPGGHDARLLRATAHLNRHPHEGTTLPEISVLAGASPRTLERLFRQETGLTFRQWRSRLRLLLAIERLNLGPEQQRRSPCRWGIAPRAPSSRHSTSNSAPRHKVSSAGDDDMGARKGGGFASIRVRPDALQLGGRSCQPLDQFLQGGGELPVSSCGTDRDRPQCSVRTKPLR